MAMSVVYTTVKGQILSESRGGTVSHFVPDPLGSVVMVRDTSGNTVYEAEYDPYGNIQSETGTNPSSLGYVGTLGYIKDSATSMYVRARYLLSNLGRWLTKDSLWPEEPGFVYANSAPTLWVDPSGQSAIGLNNSSGCPPRQSRIFDQACEDLRKPWGPRVRSEINKCISIASSALGTPCWPVTPNKIDCMRKFCRDGNVICAKCEEGGCCGADVCGCAPNSLPFGQDFILPRGPIIICLGTRFCSGLGGMVGEAHTFLHELAHVCGVGHNTGDSDKQCNDIWACCLHKVLRHGRTGGAAGAECSKP